MTPIPCPECDHKLKLSATPYLNQRLICPKCTLNLIVANLQPLVVDIVEAEEKPKSKPKMVEVACPACDQLIRLTATPHLHHRLSCLTCQTEIEVVNLKPLELELAVPSSSHQKLNRQRKLEARAQVPPNRHHNLSKRRW